MTLQEMRQTVREIKFAIRQANDKANYSRVQWLKWKRRQIKDKIKRIQNGLQ